MTVVIQLINDRLRLEPHFYDSKSNDPGGQVNRIVLRQESQSGGFFNKCGKY